MRQVRRCKIGSFERLLSVLFLIKVAAALGKGDFKKLLFGNYISYLEDAEPEVIYKQLNIFKNYILLYS